MAITMNTNSNGVGPFLTKLSLSPNSFNLYKELVAKGVEFKVDFLALKATKQGTTLSLPFKFNTSAIMKMGLGESHALGQIRQEVAGFLHKVNVHFHVPVATSPVVDPATSSAVAPVVAPPAPDLKTPVKLSEAATVGQRVLGTSSGSVYVTVAVSPVLKLAVRAMPSKLSVRAEASGKLSAAHKSALDSIGLTPGNGYWSAHYSVTSACPSWRVLGSMLLTPGFEFTNMVTTYAEFQNLCKESE